MKLPTTALADSDTHPYMEHMLKDRRLPLQLTEDVGLEFPSLKTTSTLMASGCKKGDAHLDFSALYKAYECQ